MFYEGGQLTSKPYVRGRMEALPCRFRTSGSNIRPEVQTSLEFRHAVASSSSPRLRSAVLAEACKSHSAKYCSRITIYECLLICYFFLSRLEFFLGLEGVLLLPGGAAWNLSFFLSFFDGGISFFLSCGLWNLSLALSVAQA